MSTMAPVPPAGSRELGDDPPTTFSASGSAEAEGAWLAPRGPVPGGGRPRRRRARPTQPHHGR